MSQKNTLKWHFKTLLFSGSTASTAHKEGHTIFANLPSGYLWYPLRYIPPTLPPLEKKIADSCILFCEVNTIRCFSGSTAIISLDFNDLA
jgi:hypothetical protein